MLHISESLRTFARFSSGRKSVGNIFNILKQINNGC